MIEAMTRFRLSVARFWILLARRQIERIGYQQFEELRMNGDPTGSIGYRGCLDWLDAADYEIGVCFREPRHG